MPKLYAISGSNNRFRIVKSVPQILSDLVYGFPRWKSNDWMEVSFSYKRLTPEVDFMSSLRGDL